MTLSCPDRPGIVRAISDRAQRQGANWTVSHMARIAGEFAGMVHFEVGSDKAKVLSDALHALGLTPPRGRRSCRSRRPA